LEHLSDCRTILRIQVGIDLVEEIEGRGITLLNGKNKRKSA